MNHANLQKVYDWLANGGDDQERKASFAMSNWRGYKDMGCGTVCCMGGYAELRMNEEFPDMEVSGIPAALVWLDLNEQDAGDLFFPLDTSTSPAQHFVLEDGHGIISYSQIKAHHAARVLKHFMETEIVDWNVAFEEEKDSK